MAFRKKMNIVLSTAFAAALYSVPGVAHAICGDIPQVKAWGGMTNARVERYIDKKLDGDWQPYVDHLEKQLSSVKAIRESGQSAKIRYKGQLIKLSGNRLDAYIQASEKRFEVVSCLAEQSDGFMAASLNNFATAAGSATDEDPVDEVPAKQARPAQQNASVTSGALRLNVATSCENGNAVFKVTNRGGEWPKASIFAIYRLGGEGKQIVSSRRMRLKANQTSTFQIKASKNPTGQLGLFVDPSWYKRGFDYDATLRCR